MFTMKLFHLLWLFILWMNVDESFQQNAQQCPGIHVDNNVQVIGDPEEATFGNVVRFSCKSSSEILLGPSEVYCDEHGEWSGAPPQCKEITEVACEVPVIENGSTPPGIREYKEHEILHFECNRGFKRTEERPSRCTKLGMKAEWSPTPACERIKCKLSLPPLQGTMYEPAFRNLFAPGETLRVTCEDKYGISRTNAVSAVSTCEDDGQWSIRPVCIAQQCPGIHVDNNVQVIGDPEEATFGNVVRFSCKSSSEILLGPSEVYCDEHGEWSGAPPQCREITCDRRDILNTNILNPKPKYRNREQASYVCIDGYEGGFQLTCTENGWIGREQCREP